MILLGEDSHHLMVSELSWRGHVETNCLVSEVVCTSECVKKVLKSSHISKTETGTDNWQKKKKFHLIVYTLGYLSEKVHVLKLEL